MGLLKRYRISSYVIIIGIVLFILSTFIGCTQNEGNALTSTEQIEKKPGLKKNQITKTVKFQDQLSISAKFSEKIASLNKKLSLTKTDLIKARVAGVQKDKQINKMSKDIKSLQTMKNALAKVTKDQATKNKQINGLNIAIKSIQAVVKRKDAELASLNTAVKNLKAVVKTKDTELIEMDTELVEMDAELVSLDKEVGEADTKLVGMKAAINCYRKALNTWDSLHRKEGLTERNLLTIAVELRRNIGTCPGI